MFKVAHMFLQVLLLFFGVQAGFTLALQVHCTALQEKVPRPQLKYMLSGQLHVIWQEDTTAGHNYTPFICCTKLRSHIIRCPSSCPQFKAMTSCTPAKGVGTDSRQCSLTVSEHLEYTVYLSGQRQGCRIGGERRKIRPGLNIAYPPKVPRMVVYSQSNGVIIEWKKPFKYVQFVYDLECRQNSSSNTRQLVAKVLSKEPLKSYYCCIRVHLPRYDGIYPYYSKTCKSSQTKTMTPSAVLCGNTTEASTDNRHECKDAEVNNLVHFTRRLRPDDSNWPFVLPSMLLQVRQKQWPEATS